MNVLFKYAILCLFIFGVSDGSKAENLDKLDIAPELPQMLPDGRLKKLENEPGYGAPISILREPPKYPKRQAQKAQGGMVEVEFMVDKNGSVFNAIVINSTHSDFEAAALEAVNKYQYQPGQMDGKPLNSSASIRIIFEMRNSKDAVGRRFYGLYKKTEKRLKAKDPNRQSIRRDLDRMADADYLTGYSLAYLYILKHKFASIFLTKREELQSLRMLLLFEGRISEETEFLDESTRKSVRMNVLQLLIQLGYYGEARYNYFWLKKEIPSAAKPFENAMKKVYEKLYSEDPIIRPIAINQRGYEFVYLTQRSFEIDAVEGKVEKLNFYCTRNFGTMDYKPDSNYQVPKSWGACDLQIVGTPDTKAKLYQF